MSNLALNPQLLQPTEPSRILVVEDDAILAAHISEILSQFGYRLAGIAATGESAVREALANRPNAILMDIHLRGKMNGIEAAIEIHHQLDIPVIYLTAYAEENLLQQAMVTQAYAYLIKPVRERELRACLEMALYKHKVEGRIAHLNQVLHAIRAIDQLISHMLKQEDRSAQKLLGESCRFLQRTRGYRLVWIGGEGHGEIKKWEAQPTFHGPLSASEGPPLRVAEAPTLSSPGRTAGNEKPAMIRLLGSAGNGADVLESILLGADPPAPIASSEVVGEPPARAPIQADLNPPWVRALRTGQPQIDILQNLDSLPLKNTGPGSFSNRFYQTVWQKQLAAAGFASSVVIPILSGGESFGVLGVFADMPDAFNSEEVELLQEVAGDIAFGLRMLDEEATRKRTEEVLRQSEERFSKAFHSNPAGMVLSRLEDGCILDVNLSYERIFGFSRDELVGKRWVELGIYSAQADRDNLVGELNAQGSICNRAVRMLTHAREALDLLISMEKISLDGQGCILTTLQDISELKRAENELRASQLTLALFVQYAPAPIAMFDRQMRYLAVSRRYLRDYRLGEQELVGRSHYEVFPEIPERWKEIHRICLGGVSQICEEDPFPRADGQMDWVRWEIHPWREPNGQVGGLLLFSEVITARKHAEREVARRIADLEVLYESSLLIGSLLDPREVGQKLLEGLSRKLNWQHSAVRIYDGQSGQIELIVLKRTRLEDEIQRRDPPAASPESGLGGWVIKTGLVVRSPDVRQDPRYVETFAGIRSGLYVPIRAGERIAGSITVESELENAFSEDDERLLVTLAQQVAIAMENARLYQTAQLKILERAQAEQELRAGEEKYRSLVESLDSGVVMVDSQGRCLYANAVAVTWTAFSSPLIRGRRAPSDLERTADPLQAPVGKSILELFPEPFASTLLSEIQWVIRENQPRVFESHILRPDSPLATPHSPPASSLSLFYRTSIQPVRDESGHAIQAVLNLTDISEIKAAQQFLLEYNHILEQRIQEATAEVADLYNNAPCGYHSLNGSGRILHINDTELAWLGYSREELIGQPVAAILTPASRAIFTYKFPEFWRTGSLKDLDLEFARKDGTTFPVVVSASAVYDRSGALSMSRSTVFDMTERKKIEQALRENEAHLRLNRDELSAANAALQNAARLKDDFLASMSHELRTPLTGILGLSQALQYNTFGELNPRQLTAAKDIESSGRHLLELINDILDLSKIGAGKLQLRMELCSLKDICQASLQMVRGLASARGQRVDYQAPEERILLLADGRRLKQVLVNLLSNAIKFTPEGGQLGLEVEPVPERQMVRLVVWDRGIGIKVEDLNKLFQAFVQLDSHLSRQYSGTGLGLALVHRMVDLHGGSIAVESVLGQGSRFTVLLPWQEGENKRSAVSAQRSAQMGEEPGMPNGFPKPDGTDGWPGQSLDTPDGFPTSTGQLPAMTSPRGGHILVTDDNPLNLQMLADFLRGQGFEVSLARSGTELLENVASWLPNLILLDIQMPGLNGLETARRIRSHPDPAVAQIPIVALTALVMPNDRESCLEAGMDEYLSKPLFLPELVEMINHLIAKRI